MHLGRNLVEVGPGLGTLTHVLLHEGCRVTAVELDRDMIQVLQREYAAHPALELVQGDAAEFDLHAEARARQDRVVVVGNLPYQATGAIVRRVVVDREALRGAVLMVQKEVRDRLVSGPGTADYGGLTVFTQAAFEVDTVFKLQAGAFYPPPKVESAVVRLVPRETPIAEENDAFRAVVRAAFQTRRKTLRNALRHIGDPERADAALASSDIDPSRRGETLSVAEFGKLAEAWSGAQ